MVFAILKNVVFLTVKAGERPHRSSRLSPHLRLRSSSHARGSRRHARLLFTPRRRQSALDGSGTAHRRSNRQRTVGRVVFWNGHAGGASSSLQPALHCDTDDLIVLRAQIFTLKPPFPDIGTGCQVVLSVNKGERPSRPSDGAAERGLTDALWQLMQRCWEESPDDRPTAGEVLRKLEVAA